MPTKEYLFYVMGYSMYDAERIIATTTVKAKNNETK